MYAKMSNIFKRHGLNIHYFASVLPPHATKHCQKRFFKLLLTIYIDLNCLITVP
jgi:hypothetical protein